MPTFFILRQFNKKMKVNIPIEAKRSSTHSSNAVYSGTIGPNYITHRQNVSQATDIPVTTSRDLITYGQMLLFLTGTDDNTDKFTLRDYKNNGVTADLFVSKATDNATHQEVTGSYSMNFPCRITPLMPKYVNILKNYIGGSEYAVSLTNKGGRGSGDIGEGNRGYINSFGAFKPSGTAVVPGVTSTSDHIEIDNLPNIEDLDIHSPYIIMPEDELIFGWQYPLARELPTAGPASTDTSLNSMTLRGKSKLFLIGSMIKDGKEYHQTLNQNLTSPAVHEIIGAEPVVDQFEIEDRSSYANSYNDIVRIDLAIPKNPKLRVEGQNGVGYFQGSVINSGSLQASTNNSVMRNYHSFNRQVTHFDQEKIYTDSKFSFGYFYNAGFVNGREGIGGNLFLTGNWIRSDYGTFGTFGKRVSPKYAFSMRHFGFYSDLFDQGKDSKTEPTTNMGAQIDEAMGPAVVIKFVSGVIEDNALIKSYVQTNPYNTRFIGNKSINATSSFGFDDALSAFTVLPFIFGNEASGLSISTIPGIVSSVPLITTGAFFW